MLYLNSAGAPRQALSPEPDAAASVASVPWIDLHDPSDVERSLVEAATGLRLPSRPALSEIESSSRLALRDGTLTLTTPIVSRPEGQSLQVSPLGFVLGREHLVTIRYAELRAFDTFAEQFCQDGQPARSAAGAFVGLLEAIIDRVADGLEMAGTELAALSRRVFNPDLIAGRGDRHADVELREILHCIGRSGDLVSGVRDALLGLGRIVAYVTDVIGGRLQAETLSRLHTLQADITSLNDYDAQLTTKVQFLLDATLGFINIQQNNGIKVLTVASIVGIPPTLIASIYGMNFKNMPELSWAWGYPYGLTLIVLSAVLPLIWFKRRGWV